ncbi:MAG: YitT family protein [Anaerolineales bacterium]|nr:YitT family protein [Anaerolineales bacterium]
MRSFFLSILKERPKPSWASARDYLLITLGALLQAAAIRLFLVPAHLINGGISGLSQIINHYTGWPIGLMIFLGNLPLFVLGWRYLGGRRFAMRTAYAVLAISIFTDLLVLFLPEEGLTPDLVLNTLYGGVTSGIGYGLVYRGQGTSGGSDILARILNNWRGITISQSYLLTDSLIMFIGGLTFSWENALYAIVMLYISGIAAEVAMEGSNVVRTALIVTSQPEPVTRQILETMERGVTILSGKGAYTGEERCVLYVVVTRSEVIQLKALVREADPAAFIVIGQAHEVLGEGFRPLTT